MAFYLEHETSDSINLDEEMTASEVINYAEYYSNIKPTSFNHAVKLLSEYGWKVYTEV